MNNPEVQREKLHFDESKALEQIDQVQTALKSWDNHRGSDSVAFQEMREADFRLSTELLPELISELGRHNRYIELEVGDRSLAKYEIMMLHGVSPSEIVGLPDKEFGPRARVPLIYFNSLYPNSRLNGKSNTFIGIDRKSVLRLVDVAESLNNGGQLRLERELTEQQKQVVSNAREVSISLTGWHNSKDLSYPGIGEARKIELGSARRMLEFLIDKSDRDGYELILEIGEKPVATHYIDKREYDIRSIRSGSEAEPGSEIKIARTVEQAKRYEDHVTWFAGSFKLVQFDNLAKAIAEGSKLEVRFDD